MRCLSEPINDPSGSIEEAVLLGSQILILNARDGQARVIDVPFSRPRPRDLEYTVSFREVTESITREWVEPQVKNSRREQGQLHSRTICATAEPTDPDCFSHPEVDAAFVAGFERAASAVGGGLRKSV